MENNEQIYGSTQKKDSSNVKTNLVFLIAAMLIAIIGVSSNISTNNLIERSQWMQHTITVIGDIQALSATYMQAQTNVRGFILTEQEYYTAAYVEARDNIRPTLQRIREATKDNPKQQHELERIDAMLIKRFARWDLNIGVRRRESLAAVQKFLRGDAGKQLDSIFLSAIEALKDEEQSLLRERNEQTTKSAQFTLTIVALGSLLALSCLGLAVYIVNRDHHRRKAAEAERDRFFTVSLDLLCVSGMDGLFKRISPAFEEVLGYPLEELYATPMLDLVHPDDIQRTLAEIERQAQGFKVLSFENRYRCKDGTYKVLSWKSAPVGDLMYGAARDITQQKKFEAELVDAQKAAMQADRAKTEFLANMSHEIRTPLNGIIGSSDLLSDSALHEDQKKLVAMIRTSGILLLKIINEILDFSKIEAGKLEIEILEFDLFQLIESQVSLIGLTAQEKDLTLKTDIGPGIPKLLKGDPSRISQILLNLMGNAVKFANHGEIVLGVQLESIRDGNCVLRFTIKDSGIGMTEAQTQRLFSPFMQADGSTARKYGGTGLGLSICRRLVEMMGGELGVVSQVDKGSTFWFTIKLEVPDQTVVSTRALISSVQATLEPAADKKSIRVLVAEDNHINQMLVMKMLEKIGYQAFLVANGSEAVDAFSAGHYDMILMDQHMPIMDGREASILIRMIEETKGTRIPIIAFTANVIQQDQRDKMAKLLDDFIIKPVNIKVLESVLAKWEPKSKNSHHI
ncbi:MAG: CHASE3 domain-containing protein [Bdellovibrio sp.]|nr:CHASE3 domain-containing protein [Bdellovibrio sp.]